MSKRACIRITAAAAATALATVALGQSPAEPSFVPLPPPSLNFYGAPGLIDMPSGEALPDGQFTFAVSNFGGNTRTTLSFQATPRISASFRYIGIQDWNSGGFATYYDRSFDVRFLLFRESRRWPAVTVGLQDFVGTGIYAAEYIAATKNFQNIGVGAFTVPGRLKLTAGLGWGRLGSSGAIGSPFGANRPNFDQNSTGGQVAYDQWFRGPAAPFAGIEWNPTDRLGLKVEYSSDAYEPETVTRNVFQRKSRLNFGLEYQASERTRIGAYYNYGSEFGVSLQFQLNPRRAVTPLTLSPAPLPVPVRPDPDSNPDAWSTAWSGNANAPVLLRDALGPLLQNDGLVLESLTTRATSAELRFRNTRFLSQANAIGRAARSMARVMPASVETFKLVLMRNGLALSEVEIRRSDLEALEFEGQASDALLAVTGISDAPERAEDAVLADGLYPAFTWSIGPYATPSYFDPDSPIRFDLGVELNGLYQFAPGWTLGARVLHRLGGNITSSNRLSNSVLPRVRTDGVLYAKATDTRLDQLYLARQWKPASDLYARVTVGYLEQMFGGISTELLWKPASSPLALGIEANYVRQREYDQRFGFRNYSVATGHVSAYYDMGNGFHGQLDVGRYLAGDIGATLTVDREFDNGWSVGGFFTLTDVSAAEFGEGSFDKGIRFQIPLNWFLGNASQQSIVNTIRPIQRDGGARLNVPGRLYGQVRDAHRDALEGQWPRVWE